MAIPDFQSLMRPLLAYAADGTEKRIKDAIESLAIEMKLSDDEVHQLLPGGKPKYVLQIGSIGLGFISKKQAQSKKQSLRIS